MMWVMFYEAAQIVLVRMGKWSWLKAWAMKITRHRGVQKAIVALAPAGCDHAPHLVDGTEFRWSREVAADENHVIEGFHRAVETTSLAGRWMK